MTEHDEFIAAFTTFLHEVVHQHREEQSDDPGPLTQAVRDHLGVDPLQAPVVAERIGRARLVDAEIALSSLDPAEQVLGLAGSRGHHDLGFSALLRGEHGPVGLGPVAYSSVPSGPTSTLHVVALGLRLMTFEGQPLAVLQRDAQPEWGREQPSLEIVAAERDVPQRFLAALHRQMRELSVLRGQVLSFDTDEYRASLGGISFHERPEVTREQVVLPDETLRRLEHHVIEIGRHRDTLLRSGQHLKRGVLLYGPPGTGKTHTVRHLLTRTAGTTAILLSGNRLGLVGEAVKIARAMEPAIVVLEDCDLVAEDRDMVDSPDSMLFELMEALDGLEGDADVAFVLTTNRPDLLEKALTQRPGRVDLALEVPLPDTAGREALFTLYARGHDLSAAALARAAARADGVTASFAKELVRRTVVRAAVDDRPVVDDDLTAALDELLSDGERFTRSLLASGATVFSSSPADEDGADHHGGGWDEA